MSGPFTGGDPDEMGAVQRVADARPRQRLVVEGTIVSTVAQRHGYGTACRCELDDGTGVLALLFLGREHVPGVVPGARCRVAGTPQPDRAGLVVWNPVYRLLG